MTTTTIKFNQYSVTMSLNPKTIYIKIIDTLSYKCYESNIIMDNISVTFVLTDTYYLCYQSLYDPDDITLFFELPKIYQIIENSFKKFNGYHVSININNNGIITLLLDESIEIFVYMKFEILIKEPTVSYCSRLDVINKTLENNSETDITTMLNDTYLYNDDPICVFNCYDWFGCYLPIIPSYEDKTKLP